MLRNLSTTCLLVMSTGTLPRVRCGNTQWKLEPTLMWLASKHSMRTVDFVILSIALI